MSPISLFFALSSWSILLIFSENQLLLSLTFLNFRNFRFVYFCSDICYFLCDLDFACSPFSGFFRWMVRLLI